MKDVFGMLLRLTFAKPMAAARCLFDLNLPRQVLWGGFWLVVIASVFIGLLQVSVMPAPELPEGTVQDAPRPFSFAILFALTQLVTLVGAYYIGRLLGGTARFQDVLALVVWVQIVLLILGGVSILLALFSAPLSAFVMFASQLYVFWLLASFMTVAHGFRSRGMVLLSMIGILFVLTFVVMVLLAAMGIQLEVSPYGI